MLQISPRTWYYHPDPGIIVSCFYAISFHIDLLRISIPSRVAPGPWPVGYPTLPRLAGPGHPTPRLGFPRLPTPVPSRALTETSDTLFLTNARTLYTQPNYESHQAREGWVMFSLVIGWRLLGILNRLDRNMVLRSCLYGGSRNYYSGKVAVQRKT